MSERDNVLVSTEWVSKHLNDPKVRIAEVDVDTAAYDQGHVPGAVGWNWTTQLCDTLVRDVIPKHKLEELLGASGIDNDTTVVLYGDNNNWFAAWAFWQLKLYSHKDVRIMDGGRKKWLSEGRELSTDTPSQPKKTYKAKDQDDTLRAYLPDVMEAVKNWLTYEARQNSPAKFSRPRACPKRASAAATFPAPRACRGRSSQTTMARSRATQRSRRCTTVWG
jgi:thiosulfate/3-mercaptopyruvate sulfurtransferase